MPCYGTEYTPTETIVYEDFEPEQTTTTTTAATIETVLVSSEPVIAVDYGAIVDAAIANLNKLIVRKHD
jgi:hypothetical protein